MASLNFFRSGRFGLESGNLSRRMHRPELQSEELEFRQLLSTGHAAAPDPVPGNDTAGLALETAAPPAAQVATFSANPTTPGLTSGEQPNPPTDNSSSSNIPGVSTTTPEPFNTANDDSQSVATSPTAAITALIPNTSPFNSTTSDPVYIVPMPVDPETVQLSIATPGFAATNSPLTVQITNSPVTLRPINSPFNFPTLNPPVGFQTNNAMANSPMNNALSGFQATGSVLGGLQSSNSPTAAPPQAPATIQGIGQSLGTELQKPMEPKLAPKTDQQPMTDVVAPVNPKQPDAGQQPKTEQKPKADEKPKVVQPPTQPPAGATRKPDEAPPRPGATQAPESKPPVPVPAPEDDGALEPGPSASAHEVIRLRTRPQADLSAVIGLVAVAGGGTRLAMGESQRFNVHGWKRTHDQETES